MFKVPSVLLPTLVGLTTYIIVSKLFPESNVDNLEYTNEIRDGDTFKHQAFKKIFRKIMTERALKIALISVFTTVGIQYFQKEIEILLADDIFKKICVKTEDGSLRIVCDIIKEHELDLHSKSMKELIIANNLSRAAKIDLLKIKLDFIINGELYGKKIFFMMAALAALITFSVFGVGGLALFLDALYKLFQEGKISRALYQQILKIIQKKWTKIPIEHLN